MTDMLAGIRVIEMANVISGPYAGMLLGDLGAEVVKIEMPGSGDPFRSWAGGTDAISPAFAAYNRGKKSVTLDLKTVEGRAAYLKIARNADVILDNFRPGTLDRMGIGYTAVQDDNPEVIYCAVTGMGENGPYRDRPTYDAIAQAMSGLWSQLTDIHDPEPVGPPISDQLTGLYAAYGILAALVHRQRTRTGRRLEVSMLGASIAFQPHAAAEYLMSNRIAGKTTRARVSQSYSFVGSDGLPFAVHLSSPPKFWAALLKVVDRPDFAQDSRFATKPDRETHYEALRAELQAIFSQAPRADWLDRLINFDVPCGPIHTVDSALLDPAAEALTMVRTFGAGERAMPLVGYAVTTPENPGVEAARPVPLLGEHTGQILADAGLTAEEIADLTAAD